MSRTGRRAPSRTRRSGVAGDEPVQRRETPAETASLALPPSREALTQNLRVGLWTWLDLPADALERKLEALEAEHGEVVHAELIEMLTRIRFPDEQAKEHWSEISALRSEMQQRLDGFVDVRVALAAYFVAAGRNLSEPKLIEIPLVAPGRRDAPRDELTGLAGRRGLLEALESEIIRSQRSGLPVSLVLIDVDDFQSYNDRHGREAGDVVLSEVARLLAGTLRAQDIAARSGGEEFAIVLPATPKGGAELVAERARAVIEERDIPNEGREAGGRLTVSLGIAACPSDAQDAEGLVRAADRAMQEAKGAGKNQVRLYGQERRSHPRVAVDLRGRYRALSGASRSTRTINLSEGGVRFRTDRELAEDELVELKLELPPQRRLVTLIGRIVQMTASGDGGFEASVRIVALGTEDRAAYARFLASPHAARGASQADPSLVHTRPAPKRS